MESMKNYLQEMLKKLGAESMIENIQTQVKLKGIQAVSAMKNFQEKLGKTGNTNRVMNYLQQNYVQEKLKKLGAESMTENMQMQVKLKGIKAVSAMKNFQEKLDKTGNTYKVMNYLRQNYVPEKLKKLGAESMMENTQMQVKSKGIESISAMKIYQEKLDKTGNTYEVMMNYSQLIVIIMMVVILVAFISRFGCKICRSKAGFETMKAPGRKTGETISRQNFESNPRSYFQNLRDMDYNNAHVLGEVEFTSDAEWSALLDDQQKRHKRASANTRKTPLDEDTLAEDDECSVIDTNMEAELMVQCVNETLCTTFANKDAIIIRNSMLAFQRQAISMGELLHRAVRKAQAEAEQATMALTDEREAMKKVLAAADARLKKESDALHDCHVRLERASIEAVESYKSSDEFQSCLRKFGTDSIRGVVAQIKAWVARDYPDIDPSGFDSFLKETHSTVASSGVHP